VVARDDGATASEMFDGGETDRPAICRPPGPAKRQFKPGISLTSLLLVVLAAQTLPGGPTGDPEAIVPIENPSAATIYLKGYPDWLEIGFGSLWVSNAGIGAVQRIDP